MLCLLVGSRLARHVFASAASLAQHSDWPLVWSVQPLLEPQRVPMQNLRQQLGMRSPPPLSAVLQHLQTVRHCWLSYEVGLELLYWTVY